MSYFFDALVLLTLMPSETTFLSKYSIYNIHLFKNVVYIYTNLYLYEPFSKNIFIYFYSY